MAKYGRIYAPPRALQGVDLLFLFKAAYRHEVVLLFLNLLWVPPFAYLQLSHLAAQSLELPLPYSLPARTII